MRLHTWTKWTVLALVLIAMFVASACCPPPNQAPSITSLTASPAGVEPGGSSIVNCVANDLDGDTLTYTWTSTGGIVSGLALAWIIALANDGTKIESNRILILPYLIDIPLRRFGEFANLEG